MNLKTASLIAFGVALAGVFFLINRHLVFSENPFAIAIQIIAVALMVWARITFGVRSFNAAANATPGKLVTDGPYHWLRHPIYAALIYFFSACIIPFPFIETVIAAILIVAGLFIRMLLEEQSLLATYEAYAVYCKRTKRIIPFLF